MDLSERLATQIVERITTDPKGSEFYHWAIEQVNTILAESSREAAAPSEVESLLKRWLDESAHKGTVRTQNGPCDSPACPICQLRIAVETDRAGSEEPAIAASAEPQQLFDLQLFYDQLVDGQIIKESDGEPWPLTKSEAEQIVTALSERLKNISVWPLRLAAPSKSVEKAAKE